MNKYKVNDLIVLDNKNELNEEVIKEVRLNVLRGYYNYLYKINYGDIISIKMNKEEIIKEFKYRRII